MPVKSCFELVWAGFATWDVDKDFCILGMGRSYLSVLAGWIQEWFWVILPKAFTMTEASGPRAQAAALQPNLKFVYEFGSASSRRCHPYRGVGDSGTAYECSS